LYPYPARPLYIAKVASRELSLFQKTSKKPSKNRKLAWSRGFSGLIYALDTESPGIGMKGADIHYEARDRRY
jgi:hypothetical protein